MSPDSSGQKIPVVPFPDALKVVPVDTAQRQAWRDAIRTDAAEVVPPRSLTRHFLEETARAMMANRGISESNLGWVMVLLGGEFWRKAILRIPPNRRVILLPHCMRNVEKCPGTFSAEGLDCAGCGACELASMREKGLRRGSTVLIAEGTPVVLRMILSGRADAILGVGCLASLERSLDQLLLAGIPAMAVPLLAGTCRNTTTDLEEVDRLLELPFEEGVMVREESAAKKSDSNGKMGSWLSLLRATDRLFHEPEASRLFPGLRNRPKGWAFSDSAKNSEDARPIPTVEKLGRDFVFRGGKFHRPFITLAAYDAATGGGACGADGESVVAAFPDSVRKTAFAMELFHKASLIHDDLEDDDPFRYGEPALHRVVGVPQAINAGDYLVGLGYDLIARMAAEGGVSEENRAKPDSDRTRFSDILGRLSRSHIALAEGQGEELARTPVVGPGAATSPPLTPLEALLIYGQKTSPAFEVALYAGVRLAWSAAETERLAPHFARFARFLGIGFQIRNDLGDWTASPENKRRVGSDFFARRPTLLWAFVTESLSSAELSRLTTWAMVDPSERAGVVGGVSALYERGDIFSRSSRLVQKYAEKAAHVAESIPHLPLRELLSRFVETLL